MSLGGSSQKSSSSANSFSSGANFSQSNLDQGQLANQQGNVNAFNQALQARPGYDAMTNQLLNNNLSLTGKAPTAGMQQLNQFAMSGNPYLQQQIEQFGGNIADQFGQITHFLPFSENY